MVTFALTSWNLPANRTMRAQVVDPLGAAVFDIDQVSSLSTFWARSASTGTYRLLLTPNDPVSTGTFSVTLSAAQSGGVMSIGAPKTVTATRPAQATSLTFTGSVGQRPSLTFTDLAFANNVVLQVVRPDGSTLRDEFLASFQVDLEPLTVAGTYEVRVLPRTETGSLKSADHGWSPVTDDLRGGEGCGVVAVVLASSSIAGRCRTQLDTIAAHLPVRPVVRSVFPRPVRSPSMITDMLLDHSEFMPVAYLLAVVVSIGIGFLALRSSHRYGNRILWALAVLSALPVVALTLVPTGGRAFATCAVQFAVPTFARVELMANVALFFPPVFFATLATRRPLLVLATGAVLSAAIEALQALVPAIGRACDTNDWAMNTLGAVVAVVVARATTALAARRQTARPPDLGGVL